MKNNENKDNEKVSGLAHARLATLCLTILAMLIAFTKLSVVGIQLGLLSIDCVYTDCYIFWHHAFARFRQGLLGWAYSSWNHRHHRSIFLLRTRTHNNLHRGSRCSVPHL